MKTRLVLLRNQLICTILSLTSQLNVHEFSDNITLHAKNLTIPTKDIELSSISQEQQEEKIKIRNVEFVTKHDFLIIFPQNILSKFRQYTLRIPFEGTLDSDLLGYYK